MVAPLVAAVAAGATLTHRANLQRQRRAAEAALQAEHRGGGGGMVPPPPPTVDNSPLQQENGLIVMTALAMLIGIGTIAVFSSTHTTTTTANLIRKNAKNVDGDVGVSSLGVAAAESGSILRTSSLTSAGDYANDDVVDDVDLSSSGTGPNPRQPIVEGGGGYRYSPTRWVESYSYDPLLWNSNKISSLSSGATTTTMERCNIPKVDASSLSREQFEDLFLERSPVVLIRPTNTAAFRKAVQKENLLGKYRNHSVTLSSANRHSYSKREVPLGEYVEEMMGKGGPQRLTTKGSDTWYHFGDNKHDEWKDVFGLYEKPNKYIFGPYASLSFGIGASGSGVPFHTHGHVFAEVLYGKKRWYLAPWEHEPPADPDESTLQWLTSVYPTMDVDGLMQTPAMTVESEESFEQRNHQKQHMKQKQKSTARDNGFPATTPPPIFEFYECTLREGEMLYIPGRWHHSTLNLGETVFMSVFV